MNCTRFSSSKDTTFNVEVEVAIGNVVSPRIPSLIHQSREGRRALRGGIGKAPHGAESAIDESRAQSIIEKDDSERHAQR